jgi:D-tyrosyl-tRNA(Tyr) deacylase
MLAAKPDQAKPLYTMLVDALQQHIHTESGQFGEHMKVQYTNDGPVTMIIELEG